MRISRTILAATAATLTSCSAHAPAPQPSVPIAGPIAGGWQVGNPADDDAQAAARFAAAQLGATLEKVEAAQVQVVAGLNYRLDLRLADGKSTRVTVWKRLDGSFALTDSEALTR